MAAHPVSDLAGRDRPLDRAAEIERLRTRMQRLHQPALPGRMLATHPALAGVVQLRAGGAYSVDGNTLALLLLAGPSAAGEWAAVIGMPDFGAEAAAELGVRLERTIMVPDPGESWLDAVAALVDVTGVVVVRPPDRVSERTAERLGARLRARGAALIALGPWPRAEARLNVSPHWVGLGRGEGHLASRRLTVEVRRGVGLPQHATLLLEDAEPAYGAAESRMPEPREAAG